MADSKSTCCALSSHKSYSKSTTFVPVIGDVICEGPGVIYVSIDPDVWRIRCQQCQKKTEHKCPLKKLKRNMKRQERRNINFDDENGNDLRLKGKGLQGEDGDEDEDRIRGEFDSDGGGMEDGTCRCPDRPGNKQPKPQVCLCDPYKPINFLLEVEVTGEQKAEYRPKKKKQNEQGT